VQQPANNPALDMPQLAVGRYLSLLKRRWWQAVPLAFVGMIVGGVSATFVPQVHKATAMVQYQGSPFVQVAGNAKDAMAGEFSKVEATIVDVDLVDSVIAKLAWPEYVQASAEEQREFVLREIDKISVYRAVDEDAASANYLEAWVNYENYIPERASEFSKALTEAWVESTYQRLEEQGAAELERLRIQESAARVSHDNARRELARFRAENRLDVRVMRSENASVATDPDVLRLLEQRKQLDAARKEADQVRAELEEASLALAAIDPLIPEYVLEERNRTEVEDQRRQAFISRYLLLDQAVRSMRPAHPDYPGKVRELERMRQAAVGLGINLGPGSGTEQLQAPKVTNPDYTSQGNVVARFERQVELLDERVAELEQAVAAGEARREELYDLYLQDDERQTEVDRLLEDADQIRRELVQVEKRVQTLQTEQFAQTIYSGALDKLISPSYTLAAIGGSLLGIAIAIGLILLWDLLQATIKSVDDVERGLGIPVLGTMVHVETLEDRMAAVGSRRRVSFAAGVLLVLTLSIVTVYYVAPARLPSAVLQVFDALLGDPEAAPDAK
jgi:hypothetical protein